jgi:uncharacterized membrane protein
MAIRAEVLIDSPVEKVWEKITDIENSADFISGIDNVEILEKPDSGLVGLKWEETRTMFGQTAKEIMWITDVEKNRYYQTRAERPDIVYISKLSTSQDGENTRLVMEFKAEISSLFKRMVSAVMGIIFNSATKNALQKDLEDIKLSLEGK